MADYVILGGGIAGCVLANPPRHMGASFLSGINSPPIPFKKA